MIQTRQVPLGTLVEYAGNAKIHDEANIEAIRASIRRFGNCDPIGVWTNGQGELEIVEGHGRKLALEAEGYEYADVIMLDHLTDEERRAYTLAHNQTTLMSDFDLDILEAELDMLADFDMGDFGFDVSGEDDEPVEVVEDEVPEDAPALCKAGDVWQLGRHRLMCGDSTDAEAVAKLMDGAKADMVPTDPPYGMFLDTDFSSIKGSLKSIGRKKGISGNKYDKVIGDNEDFSPSLILTVFENFAETSEVFLFGADYYAELIPNRTEGSWIVWDKRKESQADAIGSEFELAWSKKKHKRRMLRHDWFGFSSSCDSHGARNRVHPTQKPVSLIADIISQWGKGCEAIVDLYGGSGSTLIACEQLNRTCYMMELDPHYCDVIIERWQNLTGGTARKVA